MKIVTYNLRYIWKSENDGINSFVHRVGMLYEKINMERPDIIAFQEVVTETQLPILKRILPEYNFFGHGRMENYDGEGLYTAVRTDTYEVDKYETFWLSPTPYVAGSKFENQGYCPRTCVLTLIRNKNDNSLIRIFNIHLDNKSDEARKLGLECVFGFLENEKKMNDVPTIILGDFNAKRDDSIHDILCCKDFFDITKGIETTFHGYGKTQTKFDYIYVDKDLKNKLLSTDVWDDSHMGIYLSDHYPVCAIFKD